MISRKFNIDIVIPRYGATLIYKHLYIFIL